MRIEYEFTPEDWEAFGEYCARNAPEFQNAARNGAFGGAALLVALTATLSVQSGSYVWLLAGAVAAAAWAWYWPCHLVSHARSHMRTRERPCLRGRHTMEALPEGLSAKCDITDSTVRWSGIQTVANAGEYVFVMLGDVQGYVIPKGRVVSGDVELFLRKLSEYRA